MKNPRPPLDKRSLLFAIWAVGVALSVVLYSGTLASAFSSDQNACTVVGLGGVLLAAVQPANWLGLFVIALTVSGLWHAFKALGAKWPIVEDYKWTGLIVLAFIFVTVFGFGCS